MEYSRRDIIEYIIALVNEFGKRYSLTDVQAFRYLHSHKGVDFIEQHYGIIHTLDFEEAVDSVKLYCRHSGGKI